PVGGAAIAPVGGTGLFRCQGVVPHLAPDPRRGQWGDGDYLGRQGVGLVEVPVEVEGGGKSVGNIPVQHCSGAGLVEGAIAVVPGVTALPFIAVLGLERDAASGIRPQGAAQVALQIPAVKAAVARLDPCLEAVGGLSGDVVDQASGGVLAEQRALGAAQHFHPLDVDGGALGHGSVGQGDLVQVHADRRRRRQTVIKIADAPQRIHRGVDAGIGVGKAGDDTGEVRGGFYAPVPQLLAAEGGNCQGDVIDGLLTFLGGDDHFLHYPGLGGGDGGAQGGGEAGDGSGQGLFGHGVRSYYDCFESGALITDDVTAIRLQ